MKKISKLCAIFMSLSLLAVACTDDDIVISKVSSGDDPGDHPGDESGDQPGDEPGDHPGDEPGDHPGDEPGDQPGDDPGDQPGDDPGDHPGDEPGDQPGDEPGDQPGDEPGDHPGDEPGDQPGDQPIATVKADLLDLVFDKNGTATNVAPSGLTVQTHASDSLITYYNPDYSRYVAHFNNTLSGQASGYYRVDYGSNQAVKSGIGDGHSMEAVFRLDVPHDGSKEAKFFAAHQSGGTGFLISKSEKGQDITFLPHVGGNYIWCGSGIKPEVGRYYHVVGVWNASAGTASIYVDGELKNTVSAKGAFSYGSELWFGIGGDASSGAGELAWNGDVAVARIYNDVLTENQIADLYKTVKNDHPNHFVIRSADTIGSFSANSGYKYYIYSNEFVAGDYIRFESINSDQTIDCPTTVSADRAVCVIPGNLTSDDYRIVVVRGSDSYPITFGHIDISDAAGKQGNVKCVAHRGYHPDTAHSENSIASLKYAQELKVYGSEFDVWLTTTGDVFVNHDGVINNVKIQDSTTAIVEKLKLGNGENIPTLRAYLEQGKQVPDVKMILEIKKHSTAERNKQVTEKSLALVKELGMTEQVEWISFDYSVCKQIRAALPNAVVQYLNGDKAPSTMVADKISAIDYQTNVLTNHPDWISDAHEHNMFVNVWTVDSVDSIKSWIAKGVDVITTNNSTECLKQSRIYIEK